MWKQALLLVIAVYTIACFTPFKSEFHHCRVFRRIEQMALLNPSSDDGSHTVC